MIDFSTEPGGREAFENFPRKLLTADWTSATGPMRFGHSLTLADLAGADFFQNTRRLLAALDEADGAPATATGNLARAFVRQMFDRLILAKRTRESILLVCKVFNEPDVWSLHRVRVVCECAGLVARRKKRFQLTKVGRALLPDGQAGALFRKLFLAYFRKFDLHYDFFHREVTGIQETMAIFLWRLDTVARDWIPVRGLASQVLLPGVLDQLHAAMRSTYDTEEWILSGYALDPLAKLGLIERRSVSDWPVISDKDSIRITALWRKFIEFDQHGGRQ